LCGKLLTNIGKCICINRRQTVCILSGTVFASVIIVRVVVLRIAVNPIDRRIVSVPEVTVAGIPVISHIRVVRPPTAEAHEDVLSVVVRIDILEVVIRATVVINRAVITRPPNLMEPFGV